MKIAAAALETVAGPLRGGVGNGRQRWERREGILLRLMDGEEEIGQGEASPLPGYSPETGDQAANALRDFPWHRLPELDATVAPDSAFAPFWSRSVMLLDERLSPRAVPSARFAAESALLDVAGRALDEPAHRLLRGATSRGAGGAAGSAGRRDRGLVRDIPLNAWIREAGGDVIDTGEVLRAIARALARGIGIMKLKVGRPGRFAEELRLLFDIRERFGGGIAIRLDANEGWTLEEARRHLDALAPIAPEYVEQPVAAAELPRLADSPVPLAADESLRDPAARAALLAGAAHGSGPCRVFMLKPAALGGFEASRALARQARAAGIDVVVSHLLDGPVALAAACELALSLDPPPLASGLDAHPGLDAWPPVTLPQLGSAAIHTHLDPGLGIGLLAAGGATEPAGKESEP